VVDHATHQLDLGQRATRHPQPAGDPLEILAGSVGPPRHGSDHTSSQRKNSPANEAGDPSQRADIAASCSSGIAPRRSNGMP
jgi:hypothetical protein